MSKLTPAHGPDLANPTPLTPCLKLSIAVLTPLEMNLSDVDRDFLHPIRFNQAPHDRRSTRTMLVSDFCPRRRRSTESSRPRVPALRMALRTSVTQTPATAAMRSRHHVHAPARCISPATTVITACSPWVN